MGGRWIGQRRTTWSTVCSAPHSQAAEEAIPHLYKQERKRPNGVRTRSNEKRSYATGTNAYRSTDLHKGAPICISEHRFILIFCDAADRNFTTCLAVNSLLNLLGILYVSSLENLQQSVSVESTGNHVTLAAQFEQNGNLSA